jgi:hypothetical protein
MLEALFVAWATGGPRRCRQLLRLSFFQTIVLLIFVRHRWPPRRYSQIECRSPVTPMAVKVLIRLSGLLIKSFNWLEGYDK